jgi:hypothetical protein
MCANPIPRLNGRSVRITPVEPPASECSARLDPIYACVRHRDLAISGAALCAPARPAGVVHDGGYRSKWASTGPTRPRIGLGSGGGGASTGGVKISAICFAPTGARTPLAHQPERRGVRLKNATTTKKVLTGWALHDAASHVYPFPTFIEPGTAGGSARREHQRGVRERQERIRHTHPWLGAWPAGLPSRCSGPVAVDPNRRVAHW